MRKEPACLLLHGFAGSPFEVQSLAAPLRALGFRVEAPALPGHGTTADAFRRTFFSDWLAFAQEQFLSLTREHERVVVAGFSMGATLALTLAAHQSPCSSLQGVAALAPALGRPRLTCSRHSFLLLLAPALQYIRPEIPRPAPSPASRAIAPFEGYDSHIFLPQLCSLHTGIRRLRTVLHRISTPLLILHALHDRACPPENSLFLARQAASSDIRLRYLSIRERVTSHHMITTHQETREEVARQVCRFAVSVT